MNSLPMETKALGPVVLVAETGASYHPADQDPIQAWIELMEVVEALCPTWPERLPMKVTVGFLL